MITRRISKSGGGDHTSITSFNSYMNGLGTMTDDVTAEVWHNGTSADELTDTFISFSVTAAGFKFYLQPKAGQGFADRSTPGSSALFYDNTRGACISVNGAAIAAGLSPATIITGMQLRNTGTSNYVINLSVAGCEVKGCILENTQDVGGSGYVADITSAGLIFQRNLLVARGCNVMLRTRAANNQQIHGNALVALSGTNNYGIFGDGGNSGTTIYNNWIVGCGTDAASLGSSTGSHNATDKTSGASGLPATSLQASVTLSNEVENASTDFRIKSASTQFKNTGTAQGRATDIYNSSDSGTRDIGPFELQGAAATSGFKPWRVGGLGGDMRRRYNVKQHPL